jgi:hypothetical protein
MAPTLLRVLRETARIRRDRRGESDLPRDLGDVTAIRLASLLGADVQAVEVIGRNSGTTTRARLRVTGDNRLVPPTLFLKLAPSEKKTRLFVNLMGLGRQEVAFYRDVRPTVPVAAPRCYAARFEAALGRFVLVLEDLEARGCRFGDITKPCSPDDAHAVVTALARMHAAFWESPRFAGDLRWVHSQAEDPNAGLVARLIKRSLIQVDRDHGDIVPDDVRREGRSMAERRPELDARLGRGPLTLLHGDTHIGNMAFDGAEPLFFDWQVLRRGPGMRDIAYFMVTSLPVETRRANEEHLVRSYVRALVAGGVELGFDDAWQRYRLHAIDPWIASVVTVAAGGLQAADIARLGLERSVAALQDLETFAAAKTLLDG